MSEDCLARLLQGGACSSGGGGAKGKDGVRASVQDFVFLNFKCCFFKFGSDFFNSSKNRPLRP